MWRILVSEILLKRSLRQLTVFAAKDRQDAREFDWTRKGPLPDAPQRRVPDRAGFGRNFDNVSEAGSDRGGRRNFEPDGRSRDFGTWERKGPLSPVSAVPGREGGRPRSNDGPGFRRASPAWGEGRSQDGSRPPPREIHDRAPTAAEMDNEWRARMRPDQPPPKEPSNPPSPPAPASRPKLNLQKRTVSDAVSSPAPASAETKSSIFGGARPIDTAAREREVEEKRQLALRQKKEADEKAKAEKAEKQRIAKEQAKAEKAATAADTNGKDEIPQGGKNFDILRQASEDESGMPAGNEAEEQVEETGATADKAPTAVEIPESKANGNWRSAGAQPAETASADDEGWSTVSSKQRNNRRGQSGRAFA